MIDWSAEQLRKLIDAAPEGIVVCEARGNDHPLVYANAAFEHLTGFSNAELAGTDLRRLLGNDTDQPGRAQLRAGLLRGASARALLRNYRKDGTQFWNEVLIEPVRDGSGKVTHYVGFHRDVGERDLGGSRPDSGLPTWMREDRLSGMCSRAYFEELLRHDWLVGQRERRTLTLMMFDIDALGAYNDTFGRAAGDACIRRVAGIVAASFRRGTDLVARWEGGTLCALVRSADGAGSSGFALSVTQRVHSQHIHHPRSTRHKFLSVSAAVACLVPAADIAPEVLVRSAAIALKRVRSEQSGQVVVASAQDIAAARSAQVRA